MEDILRRGTATGLGEVLWLLFRQIHVQRWSEPDPVYRGNPAGRLVVSKLLNLSTWEISVNRRSFHKVKPPSYDHAKTDPLPSPGRHPFFLPGCSPDRQPAFFPYLPRGRYLYPRHQIQLRIAALR